MYTIEWWKIKQEKKKENFTRNGKVINSLSK